MLIMKLLFFSLQVMVHRKVTMLQLVISAVSILMNIIILTGTVYHWCVL